MRFLLSALLAAHLLAAATSPSGATGPARLVVDGAGREVRLPPAAGRLVSMAPSVTEMLVSLGLSDRIVGVSNFCVFPDGANSPARIGGLIDPDLETIVSLKPDLAIATTSGNYLEDADRISALGIPVYTLDTPSVGSVLQALRDLGDVLGAEEEAARVAGGLEKRLAAVAARVRALDRPRVLFVVWGDPLLVPGRGAFINDALDRAGAVSVSAEAPSRWTEFGLEQALAAEPEVILTVPDNRAFAEAIAADPRWATVPAVRDGRIHVIGNEIQQPGPAIVDGIEKVAALLHPDAGTAESSRARSTSSAPR